MGSSPVASVASVGGAGLKAYGDITSAQGVAAGDTFKAQMLEQNAQRGQVAAVQTGAAMSAKLAQTLGNIDAVRAASHSDITSPTAAAYRNQQEQLGLSQKAIAVDQILAQSRQEEDEAAYLRRAGKFALTQGYISAGADVLSGAAKAFTPGVG
jgi:hypothetical protein